MKKAQILSALALAFALGVAVIPTGSANAAFVKIDANGNLVTDTDAAAKVTNEVKKAKEAFGYHMSGNGTSAVRAWYYDQYKTLADDLDAVEKNINDAKSIVFNGGTLNGATLESLAKQYSDIIGVAKTQIGSTFVANVATAFPDTVKNYDDALKFIKAESDKIVAASVGVNAGATAVYNTAAQQLDAVITNSKDAIKAVEGTQANTLMADINAITEESLSDLDYAQAYTRANALTSNNGAASVAKVRNLEKAIKYAEDLRDSAENFWSADADKAIAAIEKAINGGTITDGDVEKPNNGGNKAPDTGVLAGEEGSASTTVAMVAGVATALTAAGAGVVAYRNARRSTRK